MKKVIVYLIVAIIFSACQNSNVDKDKLQAMVLNDIRKDFDREVGNGKNTYSINSFDLVEVNEDEYSGLLDFVYNGTVQKFKYKIICDGDKYQYKLDSYWKSDSANSNVNKDINVNKDKLEAMVLNDIRKDWDRTVGNGGATYSINSFDLVKVNDVEYSGALDFVFNGKVCKVMYKITCDGDNYHYEIMDKSLKYKGQNN